MKRKNVILIVSDSLRADHVSCLGYEKKTTPNIDKLAKEGVLFKKAFSYGSVTDTSIPPMMTSAPCIAYFLRRFSPKYRLREGVKEGFDIYRRGIKTILRTKITLAEVLRRSSYETAVFHTNPILSRYFGFGSDFSYYYDGFDMGFDERRLERGIRSLATKSLMMKVLSRLGVLESAKRIYFHMPGSTLSYGQAEGINEKTIKWLSENKPERFFIWIQYMDTHTPYNSPRDFYEISKRKASHIRYKVMLKDVFEKELPLLSELYDGCVRYVDYSIKSLLDALEDKGLLKDTVVIITADHGDEFKEHGGFFHSASKLYEELTHVPLVIYNSELGGVVEGVVSLLDLAPTLLDILGVSAPKTFRGESLVPKIKGEAEGSAIMMEGAIEDTESLIAACRTSRWKFILDETGKKELYDMKKDPKEKENVCDMEKDVARAFEVVVSQHIKKQRLVATTKLEMDRIKIKIRRR